MFVRYALHNGAEETGQSRGIEGYIDYIRPRCVELARVLKETGSFYYRCGWHRGFPRRLSVKFGSRS